MELTISDVAVYAGENNTRTLHLAVDAPYRTYEIRLAFLTPAGRRYLTPEITLTDGAADYALPACLLDAPGRLLAQIVAEGDDLTTVKSKVCGFDVERSIPCEDAASFGGELISLGSVHDAVLALAQALALCALKSELPTVPQNVSAFANDAGYLTQSSLAPYARSEDVAAGLAEKQDALTFDDTPTSGSENPVTSAGVYTALAQAALGQDVDVSAFVQQYQMTAALAEKAAVTHTHAAADVASGTLGVARGGTGGGTKEAACDGLKALFMEAGTTTQIDDMNELTTPGSYCVINNNVAHGPMGNLGMVGRVFVVEIRSDDYVQFALTGWSLYVRLFSQALSDEYQFGEWVEISGVITDWNKYVDGDSLVLSKNTSPSYLPLHGYYTSATKNISLDVYVPKSLENISSVTVNKFAGAMRGVQGFVDGSAYNTNWLTKTGVTVSALVVDEHHIRVVLNKDGFTNLANDTVVSFGAYNVQFTFNE